VRRDEASAKAKGEAEEQRMQEIDVKRRHANPAWGDPASLPDVEDSRMMAIEVHTGQDANA